MKRQLSFQEYRGIDLTLFAVIMGIAETLIVRAATGWFASQLYTVSVVGALTAIVLMRWGIFADILAVLGGVVFCAALGAGAPQYLVYCLGNLFSLFMLIPLKKAGAEKIRMNAVLSVAFGLGTLLLMQCGRACVAFVLGKEFSVCLGFFTTDALSLLFTGVIIWIARKMDGVFENQKHYLLRIHKAEEEKGGN